MQTRGRFHSPRCLKARRELRLWQVTAFSRPFPVCRLPPSSSRWCQSTRSKVVTHRQAARSVGLRVTTVRGYKSDCLQELRLDSFTSRDMDQCSATTNNPRPPFPIKTQRASMTRRPERSDLGRANHLHDVTHGTLLFMLRMWTRSRPFCHRWQANAADLRG